MNDTTFKLRVPTAELERWREEARKQGKSLAGYIRAKCSGSAEAVVGQVERDINKPVETGIQVCAHKKQKGSLCYKCDPKFGNPVINA